MNNTATAISKETPCVPRLASPSSAGVMTRKAGNTTYRVTPHFKKKTGKDMNDKNQAADRNRPRS